MGIFSRKRNWAVGDIKPPHVPRLHRHMYPAYPDNLPEIASDITGGDTEAAGELMDRWHRGLVTHAHQNLRNGGLSKHYADLDAVVKRPDCTTEMVYNFLLNLGPGGRSIAKDWRDFLFDKAIPTERESRKSAEDDQHTPHEDQEQSTQASEPPPSESPNLPEHRHQEISMDEVQRTIIEALDLIGIQYEQPEDRDDMYFLEREGVMLVVGVKSVYGVPAGVKIVAVVLKNVECTAELAIDLLKRNYRAIFATWSINDKSNGMVDIHFEYLLDVEQLNVPLVERMINWILDNAVNQVEELQSTYGGKRPFAVEEKATNLVTMPTGLLTVAGRYPGYEPAQAMAAFLSVPSQYGRPSYKECRDSFWMFEGGGYESVIGCFAEPDGTPAIVTALFYESGHEYIERATKLLESEQHALKQSAHSTDILGEDGLGEAIASGALRQLRPSEIGSITEPVREEPASMKATDPDLRFDGLYYAVYPSYRSYLRFYADGTVLGTSSSGEPEQVARWLGKAHTEISKGFYIFRGLSIEFSTVSSEGTVDYKGQVNDGEIELSSHSRINGHKTRTTFSFVQVALQ